MTNAPVSSLFHLHDVGTHWNRKLNKVTPIPLWSPRQFQTNKEGRNIFRFERRGAGEGRKKWMVNVFLVMEWFCSSGRFSVFLEINWVTELQLKWKWSACCSDRSYFGCLNAVFVVTVLKCERLFHLTQDIFY